MRWRGRRESSNVEDRRGQGGGIGGGGGFGPGGGMRIPIGRSAGGGGLSGIIILVVLFFVLRACGIDPLEMLSEEPGTGGQATRQQQQAGANDETASFARVVLAETEDVWGDIFRQSNLSYEDPRLVLFSGVTSSGCGTAQSAMGPFYCPNDKTIYLDTDFFRVMQQQLGSRGEFARAYVIAHEVGHHVQDELGLLGQVNAQRQRMGQAEESFRTLWESHHAPMRTATLWQMK